MACKDRLRSSLGLSILIISGLLLLTAGCQKAQTKEALSVPSVEVSEVVVKDVPIYSEWTASTDGFVNANIQAQVQGYLIEQDYKEESPGPEGPDSFQNRPPNLSGRSGTGRRTAHRAAGPVG